MKQRRDRNTVTYHIQLDKGRTTVSVDKIVSDLLSLKLNAEPGTREAHKVVRKQLEEFIAHDTGRSGDQLSRYLQDQAILFLVHKRLADKYGNYMFGED